MLENLIYKVNEHGQKQRAVSVSETCVPEVKPKEVFLHFDAVCCFLLAPASHLYLSQVFIRNLSLQDLNGMGLPWKGVEIK